MVISISGGQGSSTIGCKDDDNEVPSSSAKYRSGGNPIRRKASHPPDVYNSEATPLVVLESNPSFRIEDEFDQQQHKGKPQDATPITTDCYSYSDCLTQNGILLCLKHCIRYNIPLIPLIAATLVFVVMSLSWVDYQDVVPVSLLPPDNAANIYALKDYLGSSLEGLPNAAVASDQSVCSRIGTDIMEQQGGNAVDAAVATVLCLGVASPASSGLGGGAFVLVRSSRSHFEERRQQQNVTSMPAFVDARSTPDDQDPEFMVEAIDCREVAPEESFRDMYNGLPDSASTHGGLSIAVPGELRGLELAHARHGKLPWKDLVEPVILLARDGVPVDRHMARFIRTFFLFIVPKMVSEIGKKAYFPIVNYLSKDDGEYLREGELLRNPQLAQTLEEIAKHGADALYKGVIAENLVKDVREAGGILTVKDLHSYKAVLRTPVSADVPGYTIFGVPPPSSGGAVVIGVLRFLSGYSTLFEASDEGLSVHRMVEGLRHAFAIRMSLSDPAFHSNVTKAAVRDLTSGGYMETLRKTSHDGTVLSLSQYGGRKWSQLHDDDGTKDAEDAHEGDRRQRRLFQEQEGRYASKQRHRRLARPFGYLEDNGTSHMSVVDSDGNAVAITTSINNIFGSDVFSETTGVLLGNTMDDFGVPGEANAYGIKPSEANFIVPGKRPLSSMSPTIVLRNRIGGDPRNKWGDLVLVWGGSGGPKIINSVVQVFLNVLFRGMSLFDAVTNPRVHDQLLYHDSVVTTTEKATLQGIGDIPGPTLEVSEKIQQGLLERHHNLLEIDYTGCVQAILVDHQTKTLSAVSDLRKDGSPAGY